MQITSGLSLNRLKYKIFPLETIIQVVGKILEKNENILLGYVYGTYAKGLQDEFSDLDIGVLLKNTDNNHFDIFTLAALIDEKFDYKINSEVRILNEATLRFLYNVIKDGKPIYYKNITLMHEFELNALFDYQDIKPLLDMYDTLSVQKVLKDNNQ